MATNNVITTPKTILRMALMDLGGELKIVTNMTKTLDKEFARTEYKIGDTAMVRKPYRFVGGYGLDWDPEPLVDQVTPISITSMPHIHYQWDSREKTLDVREVQRLYSRPVASRLGTLINMEGATFAANNSLSSVGTPGTAPSDEVSYLTAKDILMEMGLSENEDLVTIIDRRMSSKLISGTKGLFLPALIGQEWKEGEVAENQFGSRFLIDQTINTRTNGTFSGSIVVNGAQQAEGGNNATMTLTISGLTGTLQQGDRFTIGSSTSATVGGVNATHPQTHASQGRQQKFTVQQTSAANPTSIVVSPAITPSGQYQNVDSAAVDQAIITMEGTTGLTNIRQGLVFHREAFAFLTVPIHEPEPGMGAKVFQETDDDTGLVMSCVKYFDGNPGVEKIKWQALTGMGALYKEMSVVVQS